MLLEFTKNPDEQEKIQQELLKNEEHYAPKMLHKVHVVIVEDFSGHFTLQCIVNKIWRERQSPSLSNRYHIVTNSHSNLLVRELIRLLRLHKGNVRQFHFLLGNVEKLAYLQCSNCSKKPSFHSESHNGEQKTPFSNIN
jgi:hypothetical protein